MKKIILTLLLSIFSTSSFANQQDSIPFEINNPALYLIPFQKDNQKIIFYVNSVMQSGKTSDPLTIYCNNNMGSKKFKIYAGETGSCQISQQIPSYFELNKGDFKNGSSGTITFS